LNVRGLGEVSKQKGNRQLAQKKNSQFTWFKKYTAQKMMFTNGWLNGDTKLSLAVAKATKHARAYSLITILIYKSTKHAQTLTVDLLFVT